ncbi:hypothetical protein [Salaquimonas pukyongi]|uniref:hypothetical protein n=1 Tax=Salaquimonas pukyongi TaxID=2712698 RepID=UPI0012EB2CAA|nr:hypothetical protein [Salaquimonas pukyongi]
MNEDRKKRLLPIARIHPIARGDHRNKLDERGKVPFIDNMRRAERRKLKREAKRISVGYVKLIRSLQKSGCGFPIDQAIREFAVEYNHRFASSGTETQPVNFDYMEPFCEVGLIKDCAPCVRIAPEHNHVFNVSDFFNHITSSEQPEFDPIALLKLPNDKIWHFTTNGHVMDLRFAMDTGNEFVVSGFSMIRRGSSMHWILLGGETLSPEEWKERTDAPRKLDLGDVPPEKRAFLNEALERGDRTIGKPRVLEGTDRTIRAIVCGEFDLTSRKHIGRCLLMESDNSFEVLCDNPEIFRTSDLKAGEIEEMRSIMIERMEEYAVLWNLSDGLLQLPDYFSRAYAISMEDLMESGLNITRVSKGGRG